MPSGFLSKFLRARLASLSLPALEERPHLPMSSQDPELLFPVEALAAVSLTPDDAEVDVPLLLYLCGPSYHVQSPYWMPPLDTVAGRPLSSADSWWPWAPVLLAQGALAQAHH